MPRKALSNGTPLNFEGFGTPNYTQVPDILFDVLLPHLSDAELRVLLYVIRRTFGFKRDSDTISLKQMVEGITTADGRVLDAGAGLSKSAAAKAAKGLVEKGIVITERNRSVERGDEPTTYRLRFKDTPLSTKKTPPCPPNGQARVHLVDTQETVIQETDESLSKFERSHDEQISDDGDSQQQARGAAEGQETAPDASDLAQRPDMPVPVVSRHSGPQNEPEEALPERSVSQEFIAARDVIRSTLAERMSMDREGDRRLRRADVSSTPPAASPLPHVVPQETAVPPGPRRRGRPIIGTSDERDLIYAYLDDFNRELLHDDAPIASLVTQAINIFRLANIPQERWPDYLYQARTAVKEHAGSITKAARGNGSYKNRGPYYFAVLRNLVSPEEPSQPPQAGHIP